MGNGGNTKDPIKLRAIPETVKETEVYEDGGYGYDDPGDGYGDVSRVEGIGEWDYHFGRQGGCPCPGLSGVMRVVGGIGSENIII